MFSSSSSSTPHTASLLTACVSQAGLIVKFQLDVSLEADTWQTDDDLTCLLNRDARDIAKGLLEWAGEGMPGINTVTQVPVHGDIPQPLLTKPMVCAFLTAAAALACAPMHTTIID